MKLREPIHFIKTMLSSGPVTDEFRISNRLAYHIYKIIRSRLLRQEYNKSYNINKQNYTLFCVCLDKVDKSESSIYQTNRYWRKGQVPAFVTARDKESIDNIRTTAGYQIDITEDQDNKYRQYGNNTSKNYRGFLRNSNIIIDGPDDNLERIYINGLIEDVVELLTLDSCEENFFGKCTGALDMEAYLDNYLLDALYAMSYESLVKVFMQMPKDLQNDARSV